jgi:hypothetical protein
MTAIVLSSARMTLPTYRDNSLSYSDGCHLQEQHYWLQTWLCQVYGWLPQLQDGSRSYRIPAVRILSANEIALLAIGKALSK